MDRRRLTDSEKRKQCRRHFNHPLCLLSVSVGRNLQPLQAYDGGRRHYAMLRRRLQELFLRGGERERETETETERDTHTETERETEKERERERERGERPGQ